MITLSVAVGRLAVCPRSLIKIIVAQFKLFVNTETNDTPHQQHAICLEKYNFLYEYLAKLLIII